MIEFSANRKETQAVGVHVSNAIITQHTIRDLMTVTHPNIEVPEKFIPMLDVGDDITTVVVEVIFLLRSAVQYGRVKQRISVAITL